MRLIPTFGDYLPLLVAAFLVAALLSLVLTPLVRRVAIRLGNVDHPDGRRVNKAPIPRGGGMAVATSFLVVAARCDRGQRPDRLVAHPASLDQPS